MALWKINLFVSKKNYILDSMNGYLHIISNYRFSDNAVLCSIASAVGSVGLGLKEGQIKVL